MSSGAWFSTGRVAEFARFGAEPSAPEMPLIGVDPPTDGGRDHVWPEFAVIGRETHFDACSRTLPYKRSDFWGKQDVALELLHGETELRYAVLLSPQALARVHTVLAEHGSVDVLLGARELLAELASPRDECIVLDPALVTPEDAESIAARLAEFPRSVIAFSSVTTGALESAVILAQRTSAKFIFRGTPNERSALERALLLIPDAPLGVALLAILEDNMNRLPSGIRNRMASMFQNGDGPSSPKALAAASAMGRRSLDRYLADAGFISARKVIEAARVTSAYRAITTSRTPLGLIASMLGYKSQRTLDAHMMLLLGTTSGRLRTDPLSCAQAADFLAGRLTARETSMERSSPHPRSAPAGAGGGGGTSLKLVGGKSHTRHTRRTASGDR